MTPAEEIRRLDARLERIMLAAEPVREWLKSRETQMLLTVEEARQLDALLATIYGEPAQQPARPNLLGLPETEGIFCDPDIAQPDPRDAEEPKYAYVPLQICQTCNQPRWKHAVSKCPGWSGVTFRPKRDGPASAGDAGGERDI